MRPHGRGELDSLYFDYPHFDAPDRNPEGGNESHPIVIAGAGPVGLIAALTLARNGLRAVVIERKSTFNDGSRAICIARQSYHILERVGAVAPFLEKALGWTTGRSFFRGQQILEFEMPHSDNDKFMPMYNLEQQYIEQYLWQAAVDTGLVEIRWQSEVISVEDEANGVHIGIKDRAGSYAIHAQWLLAADGARSTIRRTRGLKLKGESYEGRYVIADVKMVHNYSTIRRALFDPACNPGGTVLVHRQPDDIWRVDYQLGPHESADAATLEDTVRTKVAAILAEIDHSGDWELEWWSVYSANTLALDDYRDGQVFFIGDSAHIVPIFGVRGLNNGIADAENIGWKLAMVLKGHAGEGLLDSYSPERRGATLDVFANATKSTRFMTPPSHGWRVLRDAALSLSVRHPFARPFANPRQMTPYTYADGPLTAADDPDFQCGPEPGAVVSNVALAGGSYLSDYLGAGFTALLFDWNGQVDANFYRERLAELDPDICIIVVGGADQVEDGTCRLRDDDNRLARTFGAPGPATYVIRPDMHIVARWPHVAVDELAQRLATVLNRVEAIR